MLTASSLVTRPTLIDAALPGSRALHHLALIAAGALLVAALAQVRLPLPFTPVPITGQTFGVLLVGAVLGSRRGSLSLFAYLLLGGLGAPVFAGGASGWPVGPTGGYLIGFVLAAVVTGWLAERGWDRRLGRALLAMFAGHVALYAAGVAWLALYVGVDRAIPLGLLPFLFGDAIKLLLAALALPAAWRLVGAPAR